VRLTAHPAPCCPLHAVRGGGAFLNGSPIQASDTAQLSKALVATELGTRRDAAFLDAAFDRIRRLGAATRSLRCTGSCALNLCSVAMGRRVGRWLAAFHPVTLPVNCPAPCTPSPPMPPCLMHGPPVTLKA
jgi:fructose-1,6-bisphosphatase/inositol monophosphatase family enzyme